MPREVHAENDEDEEHVENEPQRESVLEDGTQTVKLEREPVDEEPVGDEEPDRCVVIMLISVSLGASSSHCAPLPASEALAAGSFVDDDMNGALVSPNAWPSPFVARVPLTSRQPLLGRMY